MLIELTPEQCDAIEEALAYVEVLHDRRIEANKHMSKNTCNDKERDRCNKEIEDETQAAEFAKSIRIILMKARVKLSSDS